MRIYTVHVPPAPPGGEAEAAADAIVLREGFSWPAFFLTPFWALWNGMWATALALGAAGFALGAMPAALGLDGVSRAALLLGFTVFVGFQGRDWRRRRLERRGYRFAGLVAAETRTAAWLRYCDSVRGAATSSASLAS